MKKWTEKKVAEIRSGVVSEGSIRIMRQRLSRLESGDSYGTGGITEKDSAAILDALENYSPRVTDAQARKGADWLLKITHTPAGKVRNTDKAREFNSRDLAVILAMQENPVFKLVEFFPIYGAYNRVTYVPVYRAYAPTGEWFDYYAGAWQSNAAGVEVMRHA